MVIAVRSVYVTAAMATKTGFDKFLDSKLRDSSFRHEYEVARAEIASTDAVIRALEGAMGLIRSRRQVHYATNAPAKIAERPSPFVDASHTQETRMNRFLPVFPIFVLYGCTINSSVDRRLSEVPAGQGLVVFSSGSEKTSIRSGTALDLRAAGSRSPYRGGLAINIDFAGEPSDFQDEHGNVRMVALEPGNYCLYPFGRGAFFYQYGSRPPEFAFRVRAGTVSYLGSIFLANGSLSVRDRRDRDLSLVRARNPGLNDVAVEQQLVRGEPECMAGVGR